MRCSKWRYSIAFVFMLTGCAEAQESSLDAAKEKLEKDNDATILASLPKGGYPTAAESKADWRSITAFEIGIRMHAYPREKKDKRAILLITEFRGGNTLREYELTGRGEESDVTDMVDWAEQGSKEKQLARLELTSLHALLKQLPPSTTLATPFSKLCLISFEQDSKWISRWYNQDDYPPQLKQILSLLNDHSGEDRIPYLSYK